MKIKIKGEVFMINKEKRYAIVIGVNDYDNNPLNYCVNDALEIKKTLINNCNFKENNVYVITSSEGSSTKDITGKYLESLREIQEVFRSEEDSILFYFAGHGSCKNNKSVIWLQDSSYPIENIFNDILALRPKVQTYIIDSCQSGSKVLTRNRESELERYIKSSKGAMFLYACQNTESAQELGKLQHGLLTYKILEAINNKELYDDGFLTFNRIVDFVQKETVLQSDFTQIPVIENNIVGFYPFAIDNEKIISNEKEKELDIDIENRSISLNDIRVKLMDTSIEKLNESLERINFEKYEFKYVNDFYELSYDGVDDLEKAIVEYVEEEKLTPMKYLIYKETEERKISNNPFSSALYQLSLINSLQKGLPNDITRYHINFGASGLKSKFKLLLSKDINSVSFGVGYIYYEAKWGGVILKVAFLIDWDGEEYNLIKDVKINDMALALESESINIINQIDIDLESFVEKPLNSWNIEREEELKRYRRFRIDNKLKDN